MLIVGHYLDSASRKAIKDAGLEVNAEKAKHMIMSPHQNHNLK